MKKEVRTICYDEELHIEAYHFEGIMKPFPNHFHEYYVIGFIEGGQRILSCRNSEYVIQRGNIVLFNPGDNHACVQNDEGTFDYRGFNISQNVMLDLARELTGKCELPGFSQHVIFDEELTCYLQPLHQLIMRGSNEFEKEEHLLLMLSLLFQKYGQPFECCIPECREEIENVCSFLQENYAEKICLDELCNHAHLSKSTLLRAFVNSKGVTPYLYLEAIRINEAKKLLKQGMPPVEAALQTGFSDQSHFTNFFNRFIGLSPGIYRDIFLKKDINAVVGVSHDEK
ncbi:AraC family transcriptional regulator [Anoxynatronum buryatiense]|uniref:AraC-type DNA-binding protein n=1 Tax=Anoxynatronum buryatiense TaxID=489973 RepID=A0AA45WVM9_9CLOT|nr:AraC family transcriptional regulator [Anoxynatronum buryatiense]SMP53914.1 AraC-type DNA-binding protein [Anoxynatronum buryatiense]